MYILIPILFLIVGSYIGYMLDKHDWNNGACKCNKGFWKSFDTDSSGAIGYKCTSCIECIWISWL